ncbi:MAG: hypothetical protein PHN31_04550 [Candidatus Gracilibacteria bacterium]|nr:hypothetical protein [Candidatus Gracilibacteria bacterium]
MIKKFIYNILKIIILLFLILPIINQSFADSITIKGVGDIKDVSITPSNNSNFVSSLSSTGFSILASIKTILMGVFIFYMVYSGAEMIMSMGTDDDKIKKAKRQIRYSLIGVIFINIPGTLYDAFFNDSPGTTGVLGIWKDNGTHIIGGSGFYSLLNYLTGLLEIVIFFSALFIFIYTGITLILGGKDSKTVSEAKLKLLYAIIVLILVGFIEIWRGFAFTGDFQIGYSIFGSLANLIMYIAPLIGLFYISLAGYYYISGNEEKIKKAKNIIIYVLLGTLILLASYSILLELETLVL